MEVNCVERKVGSDRRSYQSVKLEGSKTLVVELDSHFGMSVEEEVDYWRVAALIRC